MTIHPGIQALVWIPRVRAEQRQKFESAARNEGFDFQFTERAFDGSMVRAGDRPDYFPIYAIEPFRGTYRGTEATLGFDLGSDPGRKQLLSAIADRARFRLSPL
ncbi:MAG: hypothetical protein EXQ90_07295 [Rhodospirillales bacterium]|nr:hypothetical protein [Rhodospirillales bacterium]